MLRLNTLLAALAMGALALTGNTASAAISSLYGDNDGFGIGATSGTLDATFSNNSGDAPFTDVRLIGNGFSPFSAFAPTGSFSAFVVPGGQTITSATLTIRFGSWSNEFPLDEPNILMLDGVDLSALLSNFTANTGADLNADDIETHTIALPGSFLPNLADGVVSLNGTHISEGDGAGSFQVDFLQLDITTTDAVTAVPEPGTLALFGATLAGLGLLRRTRRAG